MRLRKILHFKLVEVKQILRFFPRYALMRNMEKNSVPKLSIISPIWNVQEYIAETMDSLLAQSYQDWEAIVMDGGSTDGTVEIMKRYAAKDSRIKFYSEHDNGVWHAIDKAIKLSRAEHICILCGQDGYVDREWFAKAMEVFNKDPQVSLVWALNRGKQETGVLDQDVHISHSHFTKKEGLANGMSRAAKKVSALAHDLTFGSSIRKEILRKKIFSKTAFFKLNLFLKRGMPDGKVPQKEAWFRYWLDSGTVFPDQGMIIDRRVYLDCVPSYKPGMSKKDEDVGPLIDFFFNFNRKGYLPWFLPITATFSRNHVGASGERQPLGIFEASEGYFSRIFALRKNVLKRHQVVQFHAPDGSVLATEQF
jgi:glycosyltransferase involved in cell wall biosynthesis